MSSKAAAKLKVSSKKQKTRDEEAHHVESYTYGNEAKLKVSLKKHNAPKLEAKYFESSTDEDEAMSNVSSTKQKTRDQEVDHFASDPEDDAVCFFKDIDLLQSHGIASADIEKLKCTGIFTLRGLQMTTRRRLCAIKGMNEAKVNRIKEAVNKILPDSEIMNGLEVMEKREQIFKIQTGSQELNNILRGGIESMAITEAVGKSGTGKTQLAHTLCVTCQIPHYNYPGGKAVFIDTENTFRPDRIREIAQRFDVNPKKVLQHISYFRADNSEHQSEILGKVAAKLHDDDTYKLIIVDSIMAHFRVDFCGKRELTERQQMVDEYLSKLQKLSEQYNVAIFGTNNVTAEPTSTVNLPLNSKMPGGDQKRNELDMDIIDESTCSSTVRIALKKGRSDTRIAKVVGAPHLPEAEATFAISIGGVMD